METEDAIKCPRCNSEDINILGMNYPKAYECKKCKYTFIKGKQALIDE
jgi:transposase-like protein